LPTFHILSAADDYVIKEHIKRLGPAALSTLEKKEVEKEKKLADEKLRSRNNELETWYEVSVGRELKMLELKKEINKLLEKYGEKPKYKIPV
jgi:hypothetical protein